MRVFLKLSLFILLAFVIMPRPAVAGTAAGPLTLDTGFRGYYSSGVSPANIYYKEFAIVGMQFLSATLSPEIALYQQYQITDGNGGYYTINYTQPAATARIDITERVHLFGEYRYSFGDKKFSAHEYSGEASLDIGDFSISGNYGIRTANYTLASQKITIKNRDAVITADYFASSHIGIEAGYTYKTTFFSTLGYTYAQHLATVGVMPSIMKNLFCAAGLNAGRDSDDYTIAGARLAMALTIPGGVSDVKVSFSYSGNYFIAPHAAGNKSGSRHYGSGGGSTRINPYLKSSIVGKSYFSSSLSFGATLRL